MMVTENIQYEHGSFYRLHLVLIIMCVAAILAGALIYFD